MWSITCTNKLKHSLNRKRKFLLQKCTVVLCCPHKNAVYGDNGKMMEKFMAIRGTPIYRITVEGVRCVHLFLS